MADKNIKRIGLYFNMDFEDERKMYEYLCTKKKSRHLKRLLEDDMNNNNFISSAPKPQIKNDEEDLDDLDIDTKTMMF